MNMTVVNKTMKCGQFVTYITYKAVIPVEQNSQCMQIEYLKCCDIYV